MKPRRPLPDGYQVVERPDGHWLQKHVVGGLWQDVSGPYTVRNTAVAKALRLASREAQRKGSEQ